MAQIRVYSRPGCHLCEVLLDELLPLVRGVGQVKVIDVETRPDWKSAYGSRIPVVEVDGRYVCQHRLDRKALRRALAGDQPSPAAS
ncbi:MAG: glutaredoxin family protein [Gammaproteobacteria bacterium]|nr:glutaredoxin family protein [Gammaproteobacteria bacterium]MDH5212597.1 glutaredoxin family protein [Gammaproteobacteria bacterium]